MDTKKIKQFIDLARSEGLAELKYETKDLKIAVSFPQVSGIKASVPASATHSEESFSRSRAQKVETNDHPSEGNLHSVTSPFVGTLYLTPAPGKPPYVKVGDKVKKGQTLCILEAMKIMNEIESDEDGVLTEICEDNESLVEYGQALFKIRKS